MEQTPQVSLDLPSSVRNGLDRFCCQLHKNLGDELASVILYGGGMLVGHAQERPNQGSATDAHSSRP